MSSSYSPWIFRTVFYKIPGLFKKCPQGNYHWFWHRLCFCGMGEHSCDWHGGIWDFKLKREYQLCKQCAEQAAMDYKVLKASREC